MKIIKKIFTLNFLVAYLSIINANELIIENNSIFRGSNGKKELLSEITKNIKNGTVVILSEIHNLKSHHDKQLRFLKSLLSLTPSNISVGLEFLYFPDQFYVDQFINEEISEEEFRKLINWQSDNYLFYRPLINFPKKANGYTLALNAPKALSSKIARLGINSLTNNERKQLPPNFSLGNSLYFDRFKKVMSGGGHTIPEDKLINYFTAQSLWDDTMAYYASEFIKNNPGQILIVIVGDFHAQYGGGLPDRLLKRGVSNIITISQVNIKGLNNSERKKLVLPHPRWGVRADYIWTSSE